MHRRSSQACWCSRGLCILASGGATALCCTGRSSAALAAAKPESLANRGKHGSAWPARQRRPYGPPKPQRLQDLSQVVRGARVRGRALHTRAPLPLVRQEEAQTAGELVHTLRKRDLQQGAGERGSGPQHLSWHAVPVVLTRMS
jgi:hypothetical protein